MSEEGNILYLMLRSITEVLSCQSLPGRGERVIWFDLIWYVCLKSVLRIHILKFFELFNESKPTNKITMYIYPVFFLNQMLYMYAEFST